MTTHDYLSHFEEAMRSLQELSENFDRQREADAQNNAKSREKRAEAARRGEMGEDWRKIQERIDNGETTLRAVFSGEDTSDAAASLRRTAQRNITKAMQQTRQDAEDNDEECPFTALQEKLAAMARETEQRVQNLQSF
ncbi:hypothetical protein [Kytococcus sedentarius]|uniref:hypothetical protein n=1 Tax=Kytococcus sedentarius TaxID=1276 RepID=UPI0006604978|nr:hypothetical protein [Kytococcus sedentarius]